MTVAGVASDLRAAIEGEVRFDAGSRALYATDALELPHAADRRRRSRATMDEVVETIDVCREHGAPIVLRGGGTSLAGQALQHRGRDRLLEVPAPHPRDRPRRDARARAAGRASSTTSATPASEQYGLTFGPDPVDARLLHARRDARQQLVRRALGQSEFHGPGPRIADNVVRARGAARTRRAARASARGETARAIAATAIAELRCCALADRYADRDPRALSRRSRAASRATTSTSCSPRRASTSRARSSARSRRA